MPSPVGHALAGAAAGWLLTKPSGTVPRRPDVWRLGLLYAALGTLPDLDLLVGLHRGPTHGVGAALIAGCVAWAISRRAALGFGAAAAYATHTLLDWLSDDTSPPLGLMALWPLSREFYHADWPVFPAVLRHYSSPAFWRQNFHALFWELCLVGPVAVLAWWRATPPPQERGGG
jgi:inner membrane protein